MSNPQYGPGRTLESLFGIGSLKLTGVKEFEVVDSRLKRLSVSDSQELDRRFVAWFTRCNGIIS